MTRFTFLTLPLAALAFAPLAHAQVWPPARPAPGAAPSAAPARDAGVDRLKGFTIAWTDAGTPAPLVLLPDGGVPASTDEVAALSKRVDRLAPSTELERTAKETAELKARVTALEQRVAEAEKTAAKLDALEKKLEALKTQLAEAEEKKAEEERRAAEKKAAVDRVLVNLNALAVQLQMGTTTGLVEGLKAAEAVLSGPGLRDVQNARAAWASGDYATTRGWINAAILDTELSR